MAATAVDFEQPIALGRFTVSLATARLFRDGVEVELRPQAFRAFKVLIQNPGRLVDYQQMIREAWDGVQVSKHTVAVTVGEIKNVLEEYGTWINCRPKFGYCLEIPESEDLLLTGRHFRNQFTRSGFENALRCFQQAAQKDSADFRAFEAIANTYLLFGAFLLRPARDLYPCFLQAYERAVALSGPTPELRLDRAFGRYIFERNPAKAELELLEAQRQGGKSAEVYPRLAMVYLARGRTDEALAVMRQARGADLLLPPLAFVETIARLVRREFDLAVERGKEAIDLHPASQFGRVNYAEALEQSGRHEEAMIQYRLASTLADAPWIRAQEARFLASIGRSGEAWEILHELQRKRETEYVDAFYLALLLDALGQRDEAFQELERAYEECSHRMLFLHRDPMADPLRGDPRFARLLDVMSRQGITA